MISTYSTGIFTLSLDFELIWGTVDLWGPEKFRAVCEIERELVIDRLLSLLLEFEVSATWSVVGHLFLDRCSAVSGCKHPEIIRPNHWWCKQDWFEHDPCGTETTSPLFYGRSLVHKILSCRVPQEIGCHTFSHVILGESGCSHESAESEILACIELAREMGVVMRSFVFPRNKPGHLDLLSRHGFTCYRGPEPSWFERKWVPETCKRILHLATVITASCPRIVWPQRNGDDVWKIPASMLYFPMHGLRRYIPVSRRIRRAIKGLESAVKQKGIFHLWFHPTNLADNLDTMFTGLRAILEHAAVLRANGELQIVPMGSLAPRFSGRYDRGGLSMVSGHAGS